MKPELHVVSTGSQSLERWLEITREIHEYVDFLHIREKSWSPLKLEESVKKALQAGVPAKKLILNNHPDVTEKYQLGGVHFPERETIHSMQATCYVGSSVHSREAAVVKEKAGADYLFFGHIYSTRSKEGVPPRGVGALKDVSESVSCPVIAIGGITPEKVKSCIKHGAAGVAVMSGIYKADHPVLAVQAFQEKLKGAFHE